jgi:hypothetical protein
MRGAVTQDNLLEYCNRDPGGENDAIIKAGVDIVCMTALHRRAAVPDERSTE